MAASNHEKLPDLVGFNEVCFDFKEHKSNGLLGKLHDESMQLWFIQAPSDVDMTHFHGMKLNLPSGEVTKCVAEDCGREYEIIIKQTDSHNLLNNDSTIFMKIDKKTNQLAPVIKPFVGQLSILENVTSPKFVIPDVPIKKKAIPEGLRPRFVPFGAVFDEYNTEDDITAIKKSKKHRSHCKDRSHKVKSDTSPEKDSEKSTTNPTKRRRLDLTDGETLMNMDTPKRKHRAIVDVNQIKMKVMDGEEKALRETPKKRNKSPKLDRSIETVVKVEMETPKTSSKISRKHH